MRCQSCGQENTPGTLVCIQCGARVAPFGKQPPRRVPQAPNPRPSNETRRSVPSHPREGSSTNPIHALPSRPPRSPADLFDEDAKTELMSISDLKKGMDRAHRDELAGRKSPPARASIPANTRPEATALLPHALDGLFDDVLDDSSPGRSSPKTPIDLHDEAEATATPIPQPQQSQPSPQQPRASQPAATAPRASQPASADEVFTIASEPRVWTAMAVDFAIALVVAIVFSRSVTFEAASQIVRSLLPVGIFVGAIAIGSAALGATWGKTPGMALVGIRLVAKKDGKKPGAFRSVVRGLFALLSTVVFGAGFFCVVLEPKRRTLHDLLCGTLLVRSP